MQPVHSMSFLGVLQLQRHQNARSVGARIQNIRNRMRNKNRKYSMGQGMSATGYLWVARQCHRAKIRMSIAPFFSPIACI
jgi:hypothetical protein